MVMINLILKKETLEKSTKHLIQNIIALGRVLRGSEV